MNLLEKILNHKNKISHSIFFATLSIWTIALFPQIFVFSSNLGEIAMGSIDNYAFQVEIFPWYLNTSGDHWYDFIFKNYGYGYGSFWWALNSFVVMPFKHSQKLMILAPRFLALFFSVVSIVLIYLKTFRLSNLFALFICFSLLMNYELTVVSFHFHNHTFLFFLGALSFYFYRDKVSFKLLCIMSFILGLGVGVKLVFFPFALMMTTIFFVNTYRDKKVSLRKILLAPLLFIYGFFFGISPLNVFLFPVPNSISSFVEALTSSTPLKYYDDITFQLIPFYRMLDEIFSVNFNISFEIIIFLFFLVSIWGILKFSKKDNYKLLSFFAMYAYLFVTGFYFYKGLSSWDIGKYTLTNLFIYILPLYLLFDDLTLKQKKLFLALSGVVLIFQSLSFLGSYKGVYEYFTSQDKQKRIQEIKQVHSKAISLLKQYDIDSLEMVKYPFFYPKIFYPGNELGPVNIDDFIYDDFNVEDITGCGFFIISADMEPFGEVLYEHSCGDKIIIYGDTCHKKTVAE
jgi:hypothetical protein